MTNRQNIEASLDLFPSLTLKALADAAEEEGENDLSVGYRWLAENNKWPEYISDDEPPGYRWWGAGRDNWGSDLPHHTMVGPETRPTLSESLRVAAYCVGKWLSREKK